MMNHNGLSVFLWGFPASCLSPVLVLVMRHWSVGVLGVCLSHTHYDTYLLEIVFLPSATVLTSCRPGAVGLSAFVVASGFKLFVF